MDPFQYLGGNWQNETEGHPVPIGTLVCKKHIDYKQAKAVSFHPEGDQQEPKPYVLAEYVSGNEKGATEKVTYDYLINATGPKLNFEATEGLSPGKIKPIPFAPIPMPMRHGTP